MLSGAELAPGEVPRPDSSSSIDTEGTLGAEATPGLSGVLGRRQPVSRNKSQESL